MYCKKCGCQMEGNAKFCKKCGTAVENVSQLSTNYDLKVEKKKHLVFGVMILQILQLVFYFIPTINIEIARWGESVNYKIRGIYGNEYDDVYSEFDPTTIIVILSVMAIIFTVILAFQIYKVTTIGHIVRFISLGIHSLAFILGILVLKFFCMQMKEQYGIILKMVTLLSGILYHVVNIMLFIAYFMLIKYVKREKSKA